MYMMVLCFHVKLKVRIHNYVKNKLKLKKKTKLYKKLNFLSICLQTLFTRKEHKCPF